MNVNTPRGRFSAGAQNQPSAHPRTHQYPNIHPARAPTPLHTPACRWRIWLAKKKVEKAKSEAKLAGALYEVLDTNDILEQANKYATMMKLGIFFDVGMFVNEKAKARPEVAVQCSVVTGSLGGWEHAASKTPTELMQQMLTLRGSGVAVEAVEASSGRYQTKRAPQVRCRVA